MLIHNLKIAFRNMRKYKNQTLISVLGLAVGFTCFALATLWIRYEIICALALVIVLCVGWQVFKSSIENPAEVMKSE